MLEHFWWGVGLPDRRAGRRPRHRRRPRLRPGVTRPAPRPARRARACCCRSWRWPGSSTGSSAAAPARAGRRRACSSRSSAGSSCWCLFVWLQRRSTHPALDVCLFRNPAFSAAAAALGLNFFALLGATFYLVYYLQGVRGYTPLQSGAALIPVALGMAIMAPRSSGLAERFGAKAVCATGFVLIALSFAGVQLLDLTTPVLAAARRPRRPGARHGRGDGAGDRVDHVRGPAREGRRRGGGQQLGPSGRRGAGGGHPRRRAGRLVLGVPRWRRSTRCPPRRAQEAGQSIVATLEAVEAGRGGRRRGRRRARPPVSSSRPARRSSPPCTSPRSCTAGAALARCVRRPLALAAGEARWAMIGWRRVTH